MISPEDIVRFQEVVWEYYRENARSDLPWRQPEEDGGFDPYKVLVSEVMLQQTQVGRVVPKYKEFLQGFPTVTVLADAELAAVLIRWSGLGYNRRAKFLWQAAGMIRNRYGGAVPKDVKELVELPGIGPNSAKAIAVYAYNQPHAFVETNIRTVFIQHFFSDHDAVSDTMLLPLVARTLDTEDPRNWYWALMDYGTHLKATYGNAGRRSRHYVKQTPFVGSRRQLRGMVLRHLQKGALGRSQLAEAIPDDRLPAVLDSLVAEAMIRRIGDTYKL